MNICIEGPSAVGKTTLCHRLEHECDYFIIQETIIELIEGFTPQEQAKYYLNRELARWKLSEEVKKLHSIVVFYTDPFKPLWFNWAFSYTDCLSLDELDIFYRNKLINKEMGFMDLYIVLNAEDMELNRRKDNDLYRARPEYDWVKRANEHRHRYYRFVEAISPGSVMFIQARDPISTFNEAINSFKEKREIRLQIEAYDRIISWLRNSIEESDSGREY